MEHGVSVLASHQVILERMNQPRIGLQIEASRAAPGTEGAILSIDYGRESMGLAIASANAKMAQPLSTLRRINRNEDMRRLRELVREHRVKQIIVGLPLRLDGTRGEMAEEAERFAQRAAKQTGVRVEMVDERLTSWEAERLREEEFGRVGHRGARAKAWSVDAVAAAVILREYLERQGTADERAKSARAE